jgi:CPA2 family monovalent cation:H+ antiporter-2
MTCDLILILAASEVGVWGALWDILVLLAASLALGTLAVRLGQSVIVGYLVAGALVGPNFLRWVSTEAELFQIAELGVALLLFAIGLEFSPRRLMRLGSAVLKTGPLQILVTGAVGFGVARLCGFGERESLVVGMIVAMSSTASVMRLLTDRVEIDSPHGRTSVGILLVQDIAVVPMMVLVSVLGTTGGRAEIVWRMALALILAVGLIGLFYGLFRFVAPRLMTIPSLRRNRDLPVLLAAIMAAGSAWATHAVGLSPALGAFTAGALLAVSPLATQIRADTRPLTTLMVTLFFSSIGMFGDPRWLLHNWQFVAGIVLAIIVGKSSIIALLARVCRMPWRYAIASGLCLAQVGEFSFVLATVAQSDVGGLALIDTWTFNAIVSATIVTLLLTPYLVAAANEVGVRVERLIQGSDSVARMPADLATSDIDKATSVAAVSDPPDSDDLGAILIIGFGPSGQRVGEDLIAYGHNRLHVVDFNPENVKVAQRLGLEGTVGDATQQEVLEHAGIIHARVVVITTPDHATTRNLIHLVRDIAPETHLVVRGRYVRLQWELLEAGAHEVVDEEMEVGRRLAAKVAKLGSTQRKTPD